MFKQLLALFGFYVFDADALARRLAADMLRLWGGDIYALGESEGKAELQRKYMEIAMATGLPGGIARNVANRAWGYVAEAQRVPVVEQDSGFGFYK